MANYKETTISGSQYQRCWRVNIENPFEGTKEITFFEEQINVIGEDTITKMLSNVSKQLNETTAGISFPILNPETGEAIPEGTTMTYQDLYVALYSLYLHLAEERDTPLVPVEEPAPAEDPGPNEPTPDPTV